MDSTGEPSSAMQGANNVQWISRRKNLKSLQAQVKPQSCLHGYRCWIRVQESTSSDTLVLQQSKFGEAYRDITSDYQWNDYKKGWFMLGMADTETIANIASTFLGDVSEIDILVEKQSMNAKWPRQKRYDLWLDDLKPNDILDCKSGDSWQEVVVVSADEQAVTVRPLGNIY
jgi:hypothetical protein